MQEFDLGGEKSFIGAWYLEDTAVCDELIAYHNSSARKMAGTSYSMQGGRVVNKDIKDSVDCPIDGANQNEPVVQKYYVELRKVVLKYIDKYMYSSAFGPWGITDIVNIQYYPPGGGFKVFHTERFNASHPATTRHLVFMTYLNDVADNGGTEFFYQKIVCPARKGLTLVWPADWTHTHKGVVSELEEKYIITGWFNYM